MTAINVRWHTEGRRQPTLIGKDASGRKIPGGPYIVWQLLALPVAPLMWSTRFSWAGDLSGLAMLVVIAAATGASFYLIGRTDFAGRNPLLAAGAAASAVLLATTAPAGKLSGNRVRRNRSIRRRVRPAPARHTPTTTGAASATAEATNPSSVQPAAVVPTTPRTTLLQAVPAPTAPAESSTSAAAPPVDQPPRLSPLEAFMAAAGKVNT